MGSRRGHEASPGGENVTHREHYDGEKRAENRRNRRAERREAREHYRGERSEIREEIDMERAGLARRLHVRLAEVEMLRKQHAKQNLEYKLPSDYAVIKKRIESLGDGTDEGLYESEFETKRLRRRAMRNDLQVLRLRVRGLRTSLRRHTSHVKPTVAPTPEEPKVPETPAKPAEPARPTTPPRKPRDEKSDEEPRQPDPPAGGTIDVNAPAEEDRLEAEQEIEDERAKQKSRAEDLIDEREKQEEEEEQHEADEKKDVEADKEKAPEPTPEQIREKGILILTESREAGTILDKYDDEFIKWIFENDPEAGEKTINIQKNADRSEESLRILLGDYWDRYIDTLVKGLPDILIGQYKVQKDHVKGENEKVAEFAAFWRYYRRTNESEMINTLRSLHLGGETEEGKAAFARSQELWLGKEFLKFKKLEEAPNLWIQDVLENELTHDERGGMYGAEEKIENGIALGIDGSGSRLNLRYSEGKWQISLPNYPNLIPENELSYLDENQALIDARKILAEVALMDAVYDKARGLSDYAKYPNKPFRIGSSERKIQFVETKRTSLEPQLKWFKERVNKYQANHLIDIHSVCDALNRRYLVEFPYTEDLSEWTAEAEKAETHFNQVDTLQKEREFNVSLTPKESYSEFIATSPTSDDVELKIVRTEQGWSLENEHPSLLSFNTLSFDNMSTGLYEAVAASKTILRREYEMKMMLEDALSVEEPDALFALNNSGQILFNNRILNRYDRVFSNSRDYDHGLIKKADFVDALNYEYLNAASADQLPITPEAEMAISGWRLNYSQDVDTSSDAEDLIHKWKKEHQLEFDEGVATLKLDDDTSIIIQKSNGAWVMNIPERYQSAVGSNLSASSIDEMVHIYEDVAPMVIRLHSSLKKVEDNELKIDPVQVREHGVAFREIHHFDGAEKVLFSGKSAEFNNFVYDAPFEKMRTGMNMRKFVKALNEIYFKEHPEHKAYINSEIDVSEEAQVETEDEPTALDLAADIAETVIEINDQASGY